MTYTYIKRSKGLLEFDFELDPESYRVGSTWQDYNNLTYNILPTLLNRQKLRQ